MRRVRSRGALPVLLGGLITLATAAAIQASDEVKISVRLDPPIVGVGEITELIIEASGDSLNGVTLDPSFHLENLEVAGGPGQRRNLSWVNGQITQTSGLSWSLRATAEGEGRVTDIVVKAGEKELSFPDKTLQITQEPQRPQRRRDPMSSFFDDFFRPAQRPVAPMERPDVRIVAEISETQPYVGEQIVYTIYLLTESLPIGQGRAIVRSASGRRDPSFEGFWAQEVELPEQSEPGSAKLGGKTYFKQAILRRALFAYNPGPQQIEATSLDLQTVFVQASRYGEYASQPVIVSTKSQVIELDVRPLPPAPPGFSGAVGDFRLESSLAPDHIESDEAATLALTISGNGQVNGIEDPRWNPPTGLKVFPPQGKSSSSVRRGQITTRRSWDFTLVPEATGTFDLPAIDFVYFDPKDATYQTLSSDPRQLTIVADSAPDSTPPPPLMAAMPPALDGEGKTPSENPMELLKETGSAATSFPGGLLRSGLAGLAGLLLLGGLFVVIRRRPRPAHKRLLGELRVACANPHPRSAASAAEEAWRSFLRERWQLPTGQPCSQWPHT
ncbi:MAG: BatD family protein, partial [Thermoanaerobaculia bacterium]|nr:BatD family protein [Thermoanaerobaculia bacterium]